MSALEWFLQPDALPNPNHNYKPVYTYIFMCTQTHTPTYLKTAVTVYTSKIYFFYLIHLHCDGLNDSYIMDLIVLEKCTYWPGQSKAVIKGQNNMRPAGSIFSSALVNTKSVSHFIGFN